MRLPWKKHKTEPEAPTFGDLEDLSVFRHHALRALCGVLMDRHSACQSPHPFCGHPGHRANNGIPPPMLVAEAIPQRSADSKVTNSPDLIAIYLCRAAGPQTDEEHNPLEYAISLTRTDPVPNLKLVIQAPRDGKYPALNGPILNPVEGDYSTGSIDMDEARPLNGNPEPSHCRWQYWESQLPAQTEDGWLLPRYHCLQVNGEWWVVEVGRGMAQQVAALDFADNPEHNFGIHDEKEPRIYVNNTKDPDSEFSKVVRENMQRAPQL